MNVLGGIMSHWGRPFMTAALLLAVLVISFPAAAFTPPTATSSWTQRSSLAIPLTGTLYVTQGWGGDVTHHGQWEYAIDFIVLGSNYRAYRGSGRRLSDYYTWEKSVYAPAAGTVIKMENSVRDNELQRPNREQPWGNYVIIDHGNGEYSVVAHFKRGSITAREGDTVQRGQLLGLAGNSGFSYAPHIHYQLQDGPDFTASTLPATFSRYYQLHFFWRTLRTDQTPQEGDLLYNPRSFF
jgi:murein DD-endopeptidase MepM/ murein hydrolase activator NlpD